MNWMSQPGASKDVPDCDIVAAIMDVTDGSERFASTKDVVERTGLSQPTALTRLKRLRDDGVIDGKQAGNGWGWWVR